MTVNIYYQGHDRIEYNNVERVINHSVDTSDGDGMYLELEFKNCESKEIKIGFDTFFSVWND